MRVGFGETWSDRSDSSVWGSRTIALVGTTALFAAAFAAMTRLGGPLTNTSARLTERTTLVYTEPPKPIERPTPVRPVAQPRTANATPNALSAPVPVPTTIAPTAPAALPPRDSSMASATSAAPNRALLFPPSSPPPAFGKHRFEMPTATARGTGALLDRAGVTAPLTPGADTALTVDRYAREIAEIQAEMARQNKPHVIGGPKGSVGIGVSIPLSLLSSGPSRAERRRNEAINADNLARLERLQRMIITRRDSARAIRCSAIHSRAAALGLELAARRTRRSQPHRIAHKKLVRTQVHAGSDHGAVAPTYCAPVEPCASSVVAVWRL